MDSLKVLIAKKEDLDQKTLDLKSILKSKKDYASALSERVFKVNQELSDLEAELESIQQKVVLNLGSQINQYSEYIQNLELENQNILHNESLSQQHSNLQHAINSLNTQIEVAENYLEEAHSRYHTLKCTCCSKLLLRSCFLCHLA